MRDCSSKNLRNGFESARKHSLFRSLVLQIAALAALAAPIFADTPNSQLPNTQPPDNSGLQTVEVWRIRIANAVDGKIDVSTDQGLTWTIVGRVITPATESLPGYLAAGYAPIGCVAATAVHAIRIRLGDLSRAYPNMINMLPAEFTETPNGFGGHVAGDSGIYTDIAVGTSVFRDLAPYVGSPCYQVTKSGALAQLTSAYAPAIGDTLVIISRRRVNPIRSILFPNVHGGNVTVTYADGTSQTVTKVVKPVDGVGRFDGTSYTGVGAVNTNHTCVITISTAPIAISPLFEGTGEERRGGFQIEPYYHNSQTEEAGAPQVMVLGVDHSQSPTIEGTAPLFFGGINLAYDPQDPAHSWICDVQSKIGGSMWLPMPEMVGDDDTAIDRAGITAFRLHRDAGDDDPVWVARSVDNDARTYEAMRAKAAEDGELPLLSGVYTVHPGPHGPGGSLVEYDIDGNFAAATNNLPYTFDWDTTDVSDGEHLLDVRIEDTLGNVISDTPTLVYVRNGAKTALLSNHAGDSPRTNLAEGN
jgi:hypothetical protein